MKLKKDLTLIHVFCIAAGAMISSGLFVLPGLAFAIAGPAVILSYAIAGLLMVPPCFRRPSLLPPCRNRAAAISLLSAAWGRGPGTLPALRTGSP